MTEIPPNHRRPPRRVTLPQRVVWRHRLARLPPMAQSLGALIVAIARQIVLLVFTVLFGAVAVFAQIKGKVVGIPSLYFWIAVAAVVAVAVFREYHRERTQRLVAEEVPRAAIEKLLNDCRDLETAVQYGTIRGSEARDAVAAFYLRAEQVVRKKASPYLDVWEVARGPIEADALLDALGPFEDALVEIARRL